MLRLTFAVLLITLNAQTENGGIISGVVRNAWSKAGLKRALVTLTTTTTEPLDAVTYSDINGAFAFTGVPPGDYYLCVDYRGYERACYGANQSGRPIPTLRIPPAQSRRDIVLAMLPLGSVSGKVTDSEGNPLPNVNVQMLRPSYARRKLQWQPVSNASTDDKGEYRISFVAPGPYRFLASHMGSNVVETGSDVTNGQPVVEQLSGSQAYPHSDTIAGAATLELDPGNELKRIDFVLPSVPQVALAGKVEGVPAGTENSVIQLSIFSDDGVSQPPVGAAANQPDFRFQFPPISAGTYRMFAFETVGSHAYRASQQVNARSSRDDLTLTLQAGSPLEGKLKLVGEGAREHGPYKIRLVPGDQLAFLSELPSADVKEDGSFRFDEVLPGIWDIGVEPLPIGSYIESMLLGDKDVLRDDMSLTGSTRDPLNIVLNMNGAVVKGTVLEPGAGEPSALKQPLAPKTAGRAKVLLAPEGKWDFVLSFYALAESDENGRFEFKSVTPGRYKIYAFDHMEWDEYWNPDFLKPYASIGESFDVPNGARLDRNAALIVRGPDGVRP